MDALAVSLAVLVDFVVAWGPYALIAYGIFASIVLALVVTVFVKVFRGIKPGRYQ